MFPKKKSLVGWTPDQKFYFYDFFQTFQRKGRFLAENDENSFLFWELKNLQRLLLLLDVKRYLATKLIIY